MAPIRTLPPPPLIPESPNATMRTDPTRPIASPTIWFLPSRSWSTMAASAAVDAGMIVMKIPSTPAEMYCSEEMNSIGASPMRSTPMIAPSRHADRAIPSRLPSQTTRTAAVAVRIRTTMTVNVVTPSAKTNRVPTPAIPHPREAASSALRTRDCIRETLPVETFLPAKEIQRPARLLDRVDRDRIENELHLIDAHRSVRAQHL